MKPLRLEMQAFGPFRGREVVDFCRLPASLFLIAGPIGAGKTTVLDALCFALYGEASGDGRSPGDLRSHHADPAQETAVALDFAVGGASYRVRRQPAQELRKKRGAGTTVAQARATLWDRTGVADPAGDGTVLAAKPRDVDERVRAILGFDAAQFRQVILLPQGKFREFLSARSNKREEILRVLFDVSRCEELERRLRASVDELEERQRDREAARRERLGEFPSREALRQGAEAKAAEAAAVEARHRALAADLAAAEAALAEGRRVEALFAQLAAAGRAHAEVSGRAGEMEALRARLAAAERARPVLPDIEALEVLHGEIAGMERSLAERERERVALDAARDGNARLLAEHRAGEAGHEANIAEAGRLEALRPRAADLERAARARDEAGRERERLAAAAAAAEAQRQELEGRAAAVEGRLPALRAEAGALAALESRLERLRRAGQDVALLAKARADLLAWERKLATAREAHGEAEAARAVADRAAQELRSRWLRSRAAALAEQLAEGQPCPVCGSTDHPAPARAAAGEVGGDEVEAAEAAREDAARREKDAAARVASSAAAAAAAAVRVEELGRMAGEHAASDEGDLGREAAGVETAVAGARAAAAEVLRLEGDLAGLRTRLREGEGPARALAADLQRAVGAAAAAAASAAHLEEAVAPDLRSADAIDRRIGALAAAVDAWRARLQELERERARIDKELSESAGFAKATRDERDAKRQREGKAAGALVRRLAGAGFPDAAACRAAALAEGEAALTRERLERFNNEVQQAVGALDEARRKVAGLAPPDLPPLEQARAAADRALQECGREAGRVQEQHRGLAARLAGLDEIEREEAEAGARGEALREIAAAAEGRNALRMRFSTYALAAWFDDVMTHTNRRLAVMSGGRYALARAVEAAGGGFKGLDLEVHDAHTGRARPADTLSGGEGFLASLALALGLADSVQSSAGGYRLESVFIDEGFGSLDAESLELAQRCIADLQRAGRLVGLISHVEEMTSWTPARVVIDKTPRGSTIRAQPPRP